MSQENVQGFYEALQSDDTLQKKIDEVAKLNTPEVARDALIHIAGEAGFDFNNDDIDEYIAELKKKTGPFGAKSDWSAGLSENCSCFVGGGAYNAKEDLTCACVVGGGGPKDKDGFYLLCTLWGRIGQ